MERDLRDTPPLHGRRGLLPQGPGTGVRPNVRRVRPSALPRRDVHRLPRRPVGTAGGPPHRPDRPGGDDGSWVRQITNGPHDDDQPRWSPDGRTLTFRSDRAQEGNHQLYALDVDAIGEARPLPEVDGVAELHAWSPGGTAVLVVVAGLEAEQSDAVGSGVIGQAEDLPPWIPEVESSESVDRTRRRLMILEIASGELRPACRADLNIWEAAWCEDDCIVAIASEDPGESAWYHARVVLIDTSAGTDRTLFESDVQLGWISSSPTSDVVAVVEAVCSDRLVVAGDLLLIDPDRRRGSPARHPRTSTSRSCPGEPTASWSPPASAVWRPSCSRSTSRRGSRRSGGRRREAGEGFFLAAAPVGDDIAIALNSAARPPELVVVSGHEPSDDRLDGERRHRDGAIDASPRDRCSRGPRPTAWRSRAS